MILLLRDDATPEAVRGVAQAVRDLGLDVVPLDEAKGKAFEVVGGDPSRVLALAGIPGLREILTRRTPLAGGEPVFPHFLLRVGVAILLILVLLGVLSAFFPAGLSDPATAGRATGAHVEWYMRPLEGLLEMVPAALRGAAGALVAIFCLLVLAWPFLDRIDVSTAAGRRAALLARAGGAVVLAALLALGLLS